MEVSLEDFKTRKHKPNCYWNKIWTPYVHEYNFGTTWHRLMWGLLHLKAKKYGSNIVSFHNFVTIDEILGANGS